jgi:GTP-sensing pleiotropic transcriptional regulator CodY
MWKYEALCIAVEYVLKNEGPHTYKQLSERIGINLAALGPVLRNMTSSGKIEARGWPKMYSATE